MTTHKQKMKKLIIDKIIDVPIKCYIEKFNWRKFYRKKLKRSGFNLKKNIDFEDTPSEITFIQQ